MGRNVFVATSLMDMCAKCGNIEKARCVFDGISEKCKILSLKVVNNGESLKQEKERATERQREIFLY